MSLAAARLGVALFVAGHYLVHHPLTVSAGPALTGAFALPWREVALAGVVVAGATGLGARLAPPLDDPAEEVVGGLVLGTLAAELAILALGLAGFFTKVALACVAGGLALGCVRGVPLWGRLVRRAGARPWLAALLVFPLAQALAPPTVYDVLSYHLPEPRKFLEAGVISPANTGQLGHYPFALEMLSALGMALTGDRAPGLIGFGYYLALLVAVAALARRVGAPARGAVFLMAATPVAQRLAGSAKPDFAMAFALTAAALFALRYRETRALPDAALAGAAAGLAASFKQLGLLLAVPVLVFARSPRALLIAALCACPWYIKTALWTSNPFYPAGNRLVYRYTHHPVLKDGWFSEHPALAHLSGDALVQVWGEGFDPLLPYRLSVESREPVPDAPPAGFGGELTPLVLVLLILGPYPARNARVLAGLAAAQFVLVSLTAQQARFYIAPLALLCPLAVPRGAPAWGLAALIAGWGLAGTALIAHQRGDFAGLSDRAYRERNVECQRALAGLRAGKLLLVYEQRTYPLRVPSVGADNWLPLTALELLVSVRSVEDLFASLRARGITHLYVSRYGLALLTGVSEDGTYQKLLRELMKRVERTYVDEHGYLLALPGR